VKVAASIVALLFAGSSLLGAESAGREKARKRLETALVLRYEEEMHLPPERGDAFLVRLRACLAEEGAYRAKRTERIEDMERCREEAKGLALVEELRALDAEYARKKLELRDGILSVLQPLERVRFFVVEDRIGREMVEIVEEVRRSRLPQPLRDNKKEGEK
jgi:hypothetical protein